MSNKLIFFHITQSLPADLVTTRHPRVQSHSDWALTGITGESKLRKAHIMQSGYIYFLKDGNFSDAGHGKG